MNKKRQAMTLLLQAKSYKKELDAGYKYDSKLSREANLSAQEIWKKDLKMKLNDCKDRASMLMEDIKNSNDLYVK